MGVKHYIPFWSIQWDYKDLFRWDAVSVLSKLVLLFETSLYKWFLDIGLNNDRNLYFIFKFFSLAAGMKINHVGIFSYVASSIFISFP